MTFTAQLEDLTATLRRTRARLLAPLDLLQHQLPRDPEIFVDDVLHFVMDQWSEDLKGQGHVLEHDESWKDNVNHYPMYTLRMAGGDSMRIHFTGEYPRVLYATLSKGTRDPKQFSDARQLQVELPITTDPNRLLITLLDGLKHFKG
jgi:hypothetical protein